MDTIIKFNQPAPLRQELKRKVDQHFLETKTKKRDNLSMYAKAALMVLWAGASYYVLVFQSPGMLGIIGLVLSLALALVGIGFNVQHDANHGGFSSKPWMNRIAGSSLDYFLGASSYLWKEKHNVRHHPFTNIPENDDDMNLSFIGRLSAGQKRYWFHRYQHWYLWFAYSFLHIQYLYADFQRLIQGSMGGKSIKRPKGWNLVVFIVGKIFFFSLAFGIPMLLHPIWKVLVIYAAVSLIVGFTFSVVFQLAHMISETDHFVESQSIPREWAVHQLQTTANFARSNKLLTWYLGGLNHQVEHHLFTEICHIHYATIATIVEQTSTEVGVRYNAHKTFFAALKSHYLFLKYMGSN